MNKQQKTAIENPCELAEQCSNARYRSVATQAGLTISTLLTVNAGKE